MPRVLHVLAQRPGWTGSGITLGHLLRSAAARGYEQCAVVGEPADEEPAAVPPLAESSVHRVVFGRAPLDFPLPGMSDVMPYRSTVYSQMSEVQWSAYRTAFRRTLTRAIEGFRPDLVHSHHVWMVSSLVKQVAPSLPVVVHCHATGLRQLGRCPEVADEVRRGNARNDAFVVLHRGHRDALREALGIDEERIHVVGSGYEETTFHRPRSFAAPRPPQALFVGKYSRAKGLPWLLDAAERVAREVPAFRLRFVGGGDGSEESRSLLARIEAAPFAEDLGRVSTPELAKYMREHPVFVLPSLYEGVPLVVLEAAACGARVVVTKLPGVLDQLAQPLAPRLELVDLPPLLDADTPSPDHEARFVDSLAAGLRSALARSATESLAEVDRTLDTALRPFTWEAVFERVEQVWKGLLPRR